MIYLYTYYLVSGNKLIISSLQGYLPTYKPIGKYIHSTGLTGELGRILTYLYGDAIIQPSSNQSEDSNLSINQFNPKISKYPSNQVRGPWID